MNSNLNELPQDSRVWIFQADRKLTGEEKAKIKERSSAFVATWSTHGKPLKSGVDIFYDHFLVLSVDETDWTASGCSIDQSFRFIKQLEDEMRISFLSRDRVALLNEGEVRLLSLETIKAQIKDGIIRRDSIIFDNLVSSKNQMDTHWKIPVGESWLKRFLPEN